jgi:hypothetical protein
MGDTSQELGFPAFYDRTHYSAFHKLVLKSGFEEAYYLPGYYSSTYFEFLTPLYLLSYIFDAVRYALGIKALASYGLWILRKPGYSDGGLQLYAWDLEASR